MTLPLALSFDLSDWTQIDFSGADCRTFFHNFCTQEINKLTSGRRGEAFVCDLKGRILSHVQVFSGEQGFRVIAVPDQARSLLPHLNKYLLGADVSMVDRSAELGLLCVCGTGAISVLQELFEQELPQQVDRCQVIQDGSAAYLIGGTDVVNLPAVLISARREDLENLRERIPDDVIAIGTRDLFELLRIEAGFPFVGTDLGPENIAQEAARTRQAISFTKGCYLGQEPIARLDALGHTNKELRGLNIDSDQVLRGAAIVVDGTPVGTVTSVARSLEPGRQVGLGIIRIRHAEPGTSVHVQTAAGAVPATVFWKP